MANTESRRRRYYEFGYPERTCLCCGDFPFVQKGSRRRKHKNVSRLMRAREKDARRKRQRNGEEA